MTTDQDAPTGAVRIDSRLAQAAARMRADISLFLLDIVLLFAVYAAILLSRFDGTVPAEFWDAFQFYAPIAIAIHLLANALAGLYGQVWLHASVREARQVILAGLLAAPGLLVLAFLAPQRVPSSVVLGGMLVAPVMVGALRFQARLFSHLRGSRKEGGTAVAVIGGGEAGRSLLIEMRTNPALGLRPVAVLDDDPRKQHRQLVGVPVLGPINDLAGARSRGATEAVLAIPSASGAVVRQVAEAADRAGVRLRVLPTVSELLNGEVSVRDIRDLEIADLLGRAQVPIDLQAVCATLNGKRVLITGAGGSIGSEIARQVAACEPAELFLLDHDETHLHDVAPDVPAARLLLADITDGRRLHRLFAEHRPEVVFHAAAHKHVPMMEEHPTQAARTNVLGTDIVAAAAARSGVERFVLISTDKAVRPKSVMGASKRVAEQVVLARAPEHGRYCAVRFGNVLGSRGSVVPTFMRQIQAGGPVTLTDSRMTRFFMSIPEAVQLVLQAGAMAEGGEVFMLDMGEPVRIRDLAERLIRLSGHHVGGDIEIVETGVRPGEKLTEELRMPEEHPEPTAHPAIHRLRPLNLPLARLVGGVASLDQAISEHDDASTRVHLFALTTGDEGHLPDEDVLEQWARADVPDRRD